MRYTLLWIAHRNTRPWLLLLSRRRWRRRTAAVSSCSRRRRRFSLFRIGCSGGDYITVTSDYQPDKRTITTIITMMRCSQTAFERSSSSNGRPADLVRNGAAARRRRRRRHDGCRAQSQRNTALSEACTTRAGNATYSLSAENV